MPSSGNLLDPASKDSPALYQVGNLSLIQRNFNRTRTNKVCCAVNIGKHRVHLFPFKNKKGAAEATPVWKLHRRRRRRVSLDGRSRRARSTHLLSPVFSLRTNSLNPATQPASTAPLLQSSAQC